jgi:hypothetical protein
MVRLLAIMLLLMLVGCVDQSRGAALAECRLRHYLDAPADQAALIPDCMNAKSFQLQTACNPGTDGDQWDDMVKDFTFDNPRCYRPLGAGPWLATLVSPM